MRLGPKLTVAMLLVAGIPLGLAGWSSTRLVSRAGADRAAELHRSTAETVAERTRAFVDLRLRAVQDAAASHAFDRLEGDVRTGALQLVFRQVDVASVVVLLDASGAAVAGPVYLETPVPGTPLASRALVTDADLDVFSRNVPFFEAAQTVAVVGEPYVSSKGAPRLTVVAPTAGGFILAVELAMDSLNAWVAGRRVGPRGAATVVDDNGRVILDQDPAAFGARADRSEQLARLAAAGLGVTVADPALGPILGSVKRIEPYGWSVLVVEPEADALAVARALTSRTLLWLAVALVAAIVLGLLISRALLKPVQALHEGARVLEGGDLSYRVPGTDRGDELGEMAGAFNSMAAEIQRWNTELEDRVKERTRELREAQDLLIRSQKMAAVGELGAGVSHEINNPLGGILGMAQIMLAKEDEGTKNHRRLTQIESLAKRIRDIVENLRRLGLREEDSSRVALDAHKPMEAALSLLEGQLVSEGIEIERDYEEPMPQIKGDVSSLTEAFAHLIQNARAAMAGGGTLRLSVGAADGRLVTIRVADTGPGIEDELHERIFEPFYTTRRDVQAKGLGLTLVHKAVEDHGGKIRVESAPGEGATFSIILPAHLERSLV